MKKICYISLFLSVFSAYSDDAGLEPKVYADISESAQEDAISFDGIRGLFGLNFASQKFNASIAENGNFTDNKMNISSVFGGMEYSKTFSKGFLIAVDVGIDISKKKKKEGDWNTLNKEYENCRGVVYPGDRTGKLETDSVVPTMALKGGYLLPKFKCLVFAKFGISKIGGAYSYKRSEEKVCDVEVNGYVPSIGFGLERKFTQKWGASLEANLSLKKTIKKTQDSVEHKIKVSRRDIRIVGTYTISSH